MIRSSLPLLLALSVNANVLLNGLAWDDQFIIGEQPHKIQETASPALLPQAYYRPLVAWSYRFDRWIWDSNPFGFHLSVYLAHALTTFLFYHLSRRLMRLYNEKDSIALLAASLFAVHPIHAEAVAWIAGRNDVFMTLFMMLALSCYLWNRLDGPLWFTLPLFVFCCVLGILSKETAIPFLLIFPALDLLLHRSGVIRWRGMRNPLLWLWVLGPIGFLFYPLRHLEIPIFFRDGISSLGTGLKTLFTALGYYLKLLCFPHPLNPFVSELPTGNAPGLLYILIGLTGLIILLWTMVRWSRSPLAIGATWFLLGIAAPLAVPFANVSATPVAERYAYLASAGFFLLSSIWIVKGWRWVQARLGLPNDGWALGGMVLILGLLFYLTLERNGVWRNEVSLWEDTVRKSSGSAAPYNNLGLAYHQVGRTEEAIQAYRKALSLKPDYAEAHNNLGSLLDNNGRLQQALQEYQAAIRLRPNYPTVHYNLAGLLADYGRLEPAEEEYRIAITLDPAFAEAHNNLGSVYAEQGNLIQAIEEFLLALQLKPNLVEAYFNLGNTYMRQGRIDESIDAFRRALQLKPDFVPAQNALDLLRPKP